MVQGNSSSKINLRYVEIRSDELVLGSEVKRGLKDDFYGLV